MTEKNPVFDLVISQETIFQALSNYSQNQNSQKLLSVQFYPKDLRASGSATTTGICHCPASYPKIYLPHSLFFLRITVFENWQKSRIQHCERSELHFEWTKVYLKMPKNEQYWQVFKKDP